MENHGRWPLRQRTRNSWATTLGWEPDAFERMARGEEPVELARSGGGAKVRDRLVSAEQAADALDKVLEDVREEFWELLARRENGD